MKIAGHEYHPRKMTAGDLTIIATLAPRLLRHIGPQGVDLPALLALWPEVIEAAAGLLHSTESPTKPDLAALPLDEAVAVLRQLLVEWLTINGSYVDQQVAPAVVELANTITTLAQRFHLPAEQAE